MKSRNISKYRTDWQILRTKVRDYSQVEDKLRDVWKYLLDNPNYPTWERVYNWAQGLEMGYKGKDSASEKKVTDFLYRLGDMSPLDVNEPPEPPLSSFSQEALRNTFNDLYVRAEKWAKKNYFNEELLSYLESLEKEITLSLKKSVSTLRQQQQYAQKHNVKSSHKFLF